MCSQPYISLTTTLRPARVSYEREPLPAGTAYSPAQHLVLTHDRINTSATHHCTLKLTTSECVYHRHRNRCCEAKVVTKMATSGLRLHPSNTAWRSRCSTTKNTATHQRCRPLIREVQARDNHAYVYLRVYASSRKCFAGFHPDNRVAIGRLGHIALSGMPTPQVR